MNKYELPIVDTNASDGPHQDQGFSSKQFLDRNTLPSERAEIIETLYREFQKTRNKVRDDAGIGFASLYVTARCHLDCLHCYAEGEFGSSSKDVPTEQMLRIINKLGLMTDRIQLTGGEVMTRRDPETRKNDVPLLVEEIHRRDLETIFQTTGMQLTEPIIAFLAEHGVKWVSLSLDGPDEETNTRIRLNPKAYHKVIEVIPILKKYGIKVKLGTVVTQLTKDTNKLRELGGLLEALDIDNWKLMQFFPREVGRSSAKNEDLLGIGQEEFLQVVSPVVEEYRDRIKRVSLHTLENFSQSPALLVQPTGLVTVTIGMKDHEIGNILNDSREAFMDKCRSVGVIDKIDENEFKTY